MYFLVGFLTENREGGRAGGRPCLEQVSPPLPPAAPPEEETSCRLRCKPRGLCRRLAGSPGPGFGEAGAAPGAYLPFRNIIPGKFRLREGEGDVGTGRGREPGAQISTRILFAHTAPASDRAGRGMDRGMFSLSGGMHVERKWSSSEPNFLKNPQATQPAQPPPLGRSRAVAAVGDREAPGARNLTSARARESGWPPLGLGAQAGTGRCAARRRRGRDCDSARPHLPGAGARPPRSRRPRSRLPLVRRPPASPPARSPPRSSPWSFALGRFASESPSL